MTNPPSNPMTISLTVAPGCRAVCVRIAGDVDPPGRAALARTARQMAATRCRSVYIDLSGITFAGSTLVNFLFAVSTQRAARSSVLLCGPTPIVRRIIELTGLDSSARIRDGLPADWAATPALPATRTRPASMAVAA